MKQVLIIPDRNQMRECLKLAEEYGLGFEYNDFYLPTVLDDENEQNHIVAEYRKYSLPEYTTIHGAFFDVIPFSVDAKIREISDLRIRQSIQAAERVGAKGVVFHTNYNPFLNTPGYINSWVETNMQYWSDVLETYPEMNIYLENMFDTTPDLLEALSERLGSYGNYGVCLDYAHAFLSKVAPEIWAERLGRFVKHIHINDNDGVGDLHLAWGDGRINREKFYECYEKYMKGATVLVETSSVEDKIRSLEKLQQEGFLQG